MLLSLEVGELIITVDETRQDVMVAWANETRPSTAGLNNGATRQLSLRSICWVDGHQHCRKLYVRLVIRSPVLSGEEDFSRRPKVNTEEE